MSTQVLISCLVMLVGFVLFVLMRDRNKFLMILGGVVAVVGLLYFFLQSFAV